MRLAILGASGHGKVVADAAESSAWKDIVFYDDAWPALQQNGPWPVNGGTEQLLQSLNEFDGVIVAIGDNRTREDKQRQLSAAGARLVSVVHPDATISPHATLGSGTVVFANAVVNACASVGPGCIVNTGAVVEHDCIVGEFSHISPNAVLAGGVNLGQGAWVGACASVRQMVEVGAFTVVGMGAVVTRNVPAGTVVVGSPARPLIS